MRLAVTASSSATTIASTVTLMANTAVTCMELRYFGSAKSLE